MGKIHRKYNQQHPTKQKNTKKKQKKENLISNTKNDKKENENALTEATKRISTKIETKQKKKQQKRSSIIKKAGDDTKYIKLSDFTPTMVARRKEEERKEEEYEEEQDENEEEEERKDFSAKESFSNPKSRKYFGKDQIFTTLDRRRSKYEDIMLMDPVSLIKQKQHKTNTLGTKRRSIA